MKAAIKSMSSQTYAKITVKRATKFKGRHSSMAKESSDIEE